MVHDNNLVWAREGDLSQYSVTQVNHEVQAKGESLSHHGEKNLASLNATQTNQ